MMLDQIGQQLGNYRLIRKLREDDFAHVYLGEHVYLKKLAVVKVLRSQVTEKLQADLLLKEAQIIAGLDHPHIVRILEFGVEQEVSFLVMSYAPNGTLGQRHPQGSQLPLATIVSYLKQLASALQYAHEHNVIHRDVKPQNMLIGLNDEILLSDFGLAIVFESTSSQNQMQQTGAVTYMAPEQFQGKARPASDQYALGVVVYEWLCGESPFHGTDREIAIQHQCALPPLLHEKVPTIPTKLEQVVLKALAKDPEQRFASVQVFATAFEQACQLSTPALTASRDHVSGPSSIAGLRPQAAPYSISPVSSLVPQSTITTHPIGHSRTRVGMLLGLALMVIMFIAAIGSAGMLNPARINSHTPIHATAAVQAPGLATATAATGAYTTATTNGVMTGFDAQHTNFNPYERVLNITNVSHLVLDWTAFSGSSGFPPVIANGTVYISSQDGNLYALDVQTGKTRWAASPGGIFESTPAVANGIVYIDSQDNKLYAYNASTGNRLWSTSAGDASSDPVVANGVVFVGSADHNLYAFNASSGKQLWSASTSNSISSAPAIANGVVYVGSLNHNLYAFAASTGKQLWVVPVAFAGSQDSMGSPMVANGIVYVNSDDGKLYTFDAETGKGLWSVNGGILAVANGVAFGGTVNGFCAFDAFTGKRLWTASIRGAPAVANGVVFVGSVFNFYAFDAFTGHLLWSAPQKNEVYSSPVVANSVVYIDSDNGFYAYHLSA